MTTNVLALIIVIGVLVFFHEFGHFIVARMFGVGVEIFSLGFGPRLFGKKVGMTDYRVSAIPLGGFVKMVGDEVDKDVDPEMIPYSFNHKSVYKRMLIVFAGPFFNVLLTVLIFWGVNFFYGTNEPDAIIGKIQEGSPADQAGFMVGDRILSVDGVTIETWKEMSSLIKGGDGKEVAIKTKRDDTILTLNLKPKLSMTKNMFGEDVKEYLIGVMSSDKYIHTELGVVSSLSLGLNQTWEFIELTVLSVVKMVQRKIPLDGLGGPIRIAEMAGDQARAGALNLIYFIALISINLAIINLFPVPVLDGGHLLFFTIEAVKGSPLSEEAREKALKIGVFLIIMLVIFVFYNDLNYYFKTKDI